LSVPAYFFLKPLFRLIRRALSRWSLDLANRHRMAGAARARKLDEAAGAYQRDNLLKRVLNAGQSIHAELAHRVRWQLRRLRKAMRGAGKSLDKLARQSGELRNAMLAISASSGGAGALPPQPEMLSETEALRKAHMRLTVSSLLVAALVFVNTGMLSQILRDLNIIPPSYAVLGIPLFYFLALMITLIEAGLGFVHGILSENEPGEEEKIHFGAWAVVLAAMGIACVEGFFYSRISPDRTRIVTIPIVNYGVPEPDIFFIWGFLLVMTLFLLGLMWYRAFSSVLHGSAPRKLYKTLGRIRSRAADCESAVRESLGIVKTAQETLSKDSGGTVDRKCCNWRTQPVSGSVFPSLPAEPWSCSDWTVFTGCWRGLTSGFTGFSRLGRFWRFLAPGCCWPPARSWSKQTPGSRWRRRRGPACSASRLPHC